MFVKKILRIPSLIVFVAALSCLAAAQSRDGRPEPRLPQAGAAPARESAPSADENTSTKGGGEDIEQLKLKVEQLQMVVEQQQRALAEMRKSIEALTSQTASLKPASATPTAADSRAAAPAAATEAIQADKGAAAPTAQGDARGGERPAALAGWDRDHAFLRSADGAFETRLTGFSHFDFRGYQSGNHPPNTYLVRRARIALEGKLARYYDFKVEGDFADTTSTLLRDFYLNIHRVDEFQLRFGQFKEPFSQEEIRADIYQDFVERSLVNNLAPSRSPGLMASGVIGKGAFEYQVGSFNGKGLLAPNNNGTPENVIRLRFAPWRNSQALPLIKGLAFGGAFAQGRTFGGLSVRGQTESRSFTYFTPDTVNGKVIRANGELTWAHGPAAIRAEYDQTNQERENLGAGGRNLPGVVAKGYMAQATYLLTGETKPDAGIVTPKRNLFSSEGGRQGFGAWELKFRFASLQISDGTAKSNRAETIYFGSNWYLNRFVKYVLDLGFERFHDPVRSPNPADRNYFVILSRIQLAF